MLRKLLLIVSPLSLFAGDFTILPFESFFINMLLFLSVLIGLLYLSIKGLKKTYHKEYDDDDLDSFRYFLWSLFRILFILILFVVILLLIYQILLIIFGSIVMMLHLKV